MDDSALPHQARERQSLDLGARPPRPPRVHSDACLYASDADDVERGGAAEADGPAECGAAKAVAPAANGAPAPEAVPAVCDAPLVVEWRRLCAFVRVPDPAAMAAQRRWRAALGLAPPTKKRQILHAVSGIVQKGEMLGVLGPSGSGKTSLLSILGGRSDAEIHGAILVNGVPGLPKAVRRRIGFVTQDDLMWQSLTVQQTLTYAAELRLPQHMPAAEKAARVNDMIRLLQLDKCKATPIGGAFQRGVSGGERKRTSIAVELLTDPALLLLDEPTSGLDSTIAARLVATLHGLASSAGRSFVVSIHQPATRVFKTFDAVVLMAEGRVMYSGAPAELAAYFAPLGALQPADSNPADWLLDLASSEPSVGGEPMRAALLAAYEAKHPTPPLGAGEDDEHVYGRRGSAGVAGALRRLLPGAHAAEDATAAAQLGSAGGAKWPTGFAKQVRVLVRRNVTARAEGVLDRWRLGQVAAVSILGGLLWLHVGSKEHPQSEKGLGDVAGLLFFELLFLIFLSMFGALFAFPSERAITVKERRGGWFRLSSYYVARCIADLPLDIVVPFGFVVILYFMGGLRASVFVPHLLVVLVAVLVATSLGLLISAVLMELKQAQAFASVITLVTMLCGGFYIQNVPAWLEWLKWLSFITHAYAATLKLEFPAHSVYTCVRGGGGPHLCDVRTSPRLAAIDFSFPAYANVLVLLAELAALRIVTYFALRWRLR